MYVYCCFFFVVVVLFLLLFLLLLLWYLLLLLFITYCLFLIKKHVESFDTHSHTLQRNTTQHNTTCKTITNTCTPGNRFYLHSYSDILALLVLWKMPNAGIGCYIDEMTIYFKAQGSNYYLEKVKRKFEVSFQQSTG